MKKPVLAILLCASSVVASEIDVDLNNLSNISKVGTGIILYMLTAIHGVAVVLLIMPINLIMQ